MSDQGSALRVAFCGPGEPSGRERDDAEEIGSRLASAGVTLYCGGLGGAMEAACRGARLAGGITVGILPGVDATVANPWVQFPVCTGMGQARNVVLVTSADVVVASGGGWGTLSEIAIAARIGRPVVVHGALSNVIAATMDGQHGTPTPEITFANSPAEAVQAVLSHRGTGA